jgi:hypothetical protein
MKIKWKNVILLAIFMLSVLNLGYTFVTLCTTLASLTWMGILTTGLSLLVASMIGEYLIDEMQ